MAKRFFKLLYVFALIAIGLSLPLYLLTSIHPDRVVLTSYKVKCLSNNQYVVLQGDSKAVIMEETYLNSEYSTEIKKQMNFYCKYYDKVQPHIAAYNESKTRADEVAANISFSNFRDSLDSTVSSYPLLYKLEVESEEMQLQEIYSPIIDWLVGALLAFLLLQIARICYVYVVFNKVVWHPFRKIETE